MFKFENKIDNEKIQTIILCPLYYYIIGVPFTLVTKRPNIFSKKTFDHHNKFLVISLNN